LLWVKRGGHRLCKVISTLRLLSAIVEGLDEHLSWADENCICELTVVFPGILNGCIRVGDVKEYKIEKSKNQKIQSRKKVLEW
jgi:hypothetical protein